MLDKIYLVFLLISVVLSDGNTADVKVDDKLDFNNTQFSSRTQNASSIAFDGRVQFLSSPESLLNETLTKSKENKSTADEFRPSPQVKEIAYERNIFPVKPAHPEAKHRHESSWSSSLPDNFFPQSIVQTSRDKPYKFDSGGSHHYGFSGKNDYESPIHKPQINLGSKVPVSSSGSGSAIGGSWEVGYPRKPSYGYEVGGYIEKPPTGIEHHSYEYSTKKYDNPWKKIIKIIAAFIPIGLLISALTPTIITVSPMNATMMRSRNDDPQAVTIKKLISSLGYFDDISDANCENRILCEILLSASSSHHAKQHIENFLLNFSESGKYSTENIGELKKIFGAVKKRKCETIYCKGIKENT